MKLAPAHFHFNFPLFLLPRKSLHIFSNASSALLSVAFYFVLEAWSSNICLICGQTKIPSCIWPHLFWEIFASIGKPFAFFIRRQPKALKRSCSKSPVPILYLRPYCQNTFLKCFDSGFLRNFYTISPQMWQELFGLFWQERDKLHTRKIIFKFIGNCYFCTGTTHRMEDGIRLEVLRNGTTTYFGATIYHIHWITLTNNHSGILSLWNLIISTFYQCV